MLSASFYASIQKQSLPGIWAQGLKLARERSVLLDRQGNDEFVLRVKTSARAVVPRVSLWPEEGDFYCDCAGEAEPCIHVVACTIALKNQWVSAPDPLDASVPRLEYHFTRTPSGLAFERRLRVGSEIKPFRDSLVSHIAGVRSGRVQSHEISATQADLRADALVRVLPSGAVPDDQSAPLLRALAECSGVFLDLSPIEVSAQAIKPEVLLTDEPAGIRARRKPESTEIERFPNAIAKRGQTLHPLARATLSPGARACLTPEGTVFRPEDLPALLQDILPELEKHVRVERDAVELPKLARLPARLRFHLEEPEPGLCLAVARIVYGNPPVAELVDGALRLLDPKILPERDALLERRLALEAQDRFSLGLDRPARLDSSQALRLREKIQGFEVIGGAEKGFQLEGSLFAAYEHGDGLHFRTRSGARVGFADVAAAFDRGQAHVRLPGGSWAKLPTDGWPELRAEAERLLLLQPEKNPIVRFALSSLAAPEARELELDPALERLMRTPAGGRPLRVSAELRPYQREGIAWLENLEGLGALLADDMGLGKTLQALAVLQGRSLVVAPSSILKQWEREAARFRPDLKVHLYHGSSRAWSDKADLVLTSYGLLRQETERFASEAWNFALLDEAHTIKNPESQTAQSAFALQARTRIALTGTPVENRLDDLWSLFRFLTPGLLPPRTELTPEIARARTAPFLLRRTKAQVARDLPPKTELELAVELTQEERSFYQTILAASQVEIESASPLALLETLLRLRQACCDPTLVPGAPEAFFAPEFRSSKLSLALEHLRTTASEGHRTLVFSQWTSLLDRMERLLTDEGISSVRLDGSTSDRDSVVARFQAEDGPPVFLISLKAGGVGLNLTRADHVLLLDPWWNPTSEAQAADRAYRIGQEKPVFVYRLIAEDTVESHVRALQNEKLRLSAALLEGADVAPSREQLVELLRTRG